MDVSEWEPLAGSGQTALDALVAQPCHSRKKLAVPEAWEAGVKVEFDIRGSHSCQIWSCKAK